MIYVAGLDIGSISTKTVILSNERKILAYDVSLTLGDNKGTAIKSFHKSLNKIALRKEDITYIVATGYGRNNISFANKAVTEITCHALGAHFLFPGTRTVVDIGGQDSKAININSDGRVVDFIMNDKCAAGTGRFFEVMAMALDISLESLGELSMQSESPALISSFCTVFAESEVISLVADGRKKIDIIRGIHEAVGERTITLLNKVKIIEQLTMTGGVAKNKGVIDVLERKLRLKLNIPEEPQIIGALGASLVALKNFKNKNSFIEILEEL